MQAIITAAQMREADQYTIVHEPIASYDLMERASAAFVKKITKDFPDTETHIAVFCGQGNNGGDGLAIARLLINNDYLNTTVYKINFSADQTVDNKKNEAALRKMHVGIIELTHATQLPDIAAGVLIDAVLGSGLNKPLCGEYALLAAAINQSAIPVYAVDIPTGFWADEIVREKYNGIKARKTISFQRPKFSFLFPESMAATEDFEVVNIGLNEAFIQALPVNNYLLEEKDIAGILQPRKRFAHKGSFGHALLMCGQKQTIGAALLCARACLHAGAGLVTACIPETGLAALNTALPEAMYLPRDTEQIALNAGKYSVVAVGCGLGMNEGARLLLQKMIRLQKPLVVDADAINILSQHRYLLGELLPNTILTPHVKEFDRLFGQHENWYSRLKTAVDEASARKIIIVLKNRYTFICNTDGKVYINPTGSPAMAQGGMGDVLTGIIAAFLAQHISPLQAVIAACYLHGKTADRLAELNFVVSASAVANNISKEIKNIC